jgi:hypothetical protein
MHVAWGRQLLYGRLPLRDTAPLGMPLQALLSVMAERLLGDRLGAEGLVFAAAFALGAVVTFVLATRASGRIWVGLGAAMLQVLVAPRTYSYPKIVLYGVAVLVVWRYIDQPTRRRAVAAGALVALAFFLRHDHGLYIGLVTGAVLWLRHVGDWRTGLRRVAVSGVTCLALVAPYLVWIQINVGVGAWLGDLRMLATREYQQNHFEHWPRWPLRQPVDVLAMVDTGRATIGIRWQPEASRDARYAAAVRHHLVVPSEGPIGSGPFVVTDLSRENMLALIQDPVIQDTSGVDRSDGHIPRPGLQLGAFRILPALDTPAASAALLFGLYLGILGATLLTLVRTRTAAAGHDRLKIAAVVLVAVVAGVGLLRQPLEARIADAVVAPLVLSAWLIGQWLNDRERPAWRRVVRRVVVVATLVMVTRSAVVIGAPAARWASLRDWHSTWDSLAVNPAFDAWTPSNPAKYKAVQYIRDCTAPRDPMLVLWFAPDLYYFAERPFAGRFAFYLEGYWGSADELQANLDAIERDRPAIVLMESGRRTTDLYTYPRLLAYVDAAYHRIGDLAANDGTSIHVLARNDRVPSSIDPNLGWPCYAGTSVHG